LNEWRSCVNIGIQTGRGPVKRIAAIALAIVAVGGCGKATTPKEEPWTWAKFLADNPDYLATAIVGQVTPPPARPEEGPFLLLDLPDARHTSMTIHEGCFVVVANVPARSFGVFHSGKERAKTSVERGFYRASVTISNGEPRIALANISTTEFVKEADACNSFLPK
jgi:hypothetical protein